MMAQVMDMVSDESPQPVQREIRQKAVPRTVNHKSHNDPKARNRAMNREEGIVFEPKALNEEMALRLGQSEINVMPKTSLTGFIEEQKEEKNDESNNP